MDLITQVVSLAYGLMLFLKQRGRDHSNGNPGIHNIVTGTTPPPTCFHMIQERLQIM